MIEYVVVHHTAVSRKKAPTQLKQTDNYHKTVFNMKSSLGYWVGYTYFIEPDGKVIQTRKEGEEQAAQKGFNKNTISICFTGNFDEEDPTREQKATFKKLFREISNRHNVTPDEIRPHRYFCGTPNGTLQYKTIQNLKAYKTCYGSRLSDSYFKDLL